MIKGGDPGQFWNPFPRWQVAGGSRGGGARRRLGKERGAFFFETFRKAGVNQLKAGTRLLRHNAASRLVAAAVPLPTISAVLGHAHPESTNLYMSVDRLRLLDCVLPVPEAVRS